LIKRVTNEQAWEGETDCRRCTLRQSALFSSLTEHDFALVHNQVEQVTLSPGEILYNIGDPGSHLFTVRSGLIKLVQYLPDGAQRIVRLAYSTDVIGLEMMVGQHYLHDVVALRTTELCRYPIAAVNSMCKTNTELHSDLMSRWQKALTESEASLTQLSTGTAKRRMANLLLRLRDGQDSSKCLIFSREDIGSILNMTVETASRTISEFKRQGIIKEIRNNYFHLDIPAVEAIAIS
jgi:CRP/FNR family transcriptional regulator